MYVVPALDEISPPEIARVFVSTRAKSPSGFGDPGGDLFSRSSSSGLPLLLLLLKPPPGPPKPPGDLARVEKIRELFLGAIFD